MSMLFPPIDPYLIRHLDVGDGHRLYIEESGNPEGVPVVFLHGGPGSGTKPYHRSFFDPARYRIILLDQRGSGQSLPHGHLIANTTQHLIDDLEQLRQSLAIERWVVSGGSWGAALALLYAQVHPSRVAGLVLRGSFLARKRDVDWFMGPEGVRRIYPDYWGDLLEGVDAGPYEGLALLQQLYQQLLGEDELACRRAVRAWWLWGGRVTLGAAFNPDSGKGLPSGALSQARIELHYAANRYFIEENQILEQCNRLAGIPVMLVHGREDLVCPMESAWVLHQALPGSSFCVVPDAGHIANHEGMIAALVRAGNAMLEQCSK